jgi:starch phosphorylase
LADYQAYIECQKQVAIAYQDQQKWTKMSILNSARMGKFSSDRSIREYCEEIWDVKPIKIKLEEQ